MIALELFKRAGGQRSLNSRLGKWAKAVSVSFELGLPKHTVPLLKAAAGEIDLSSAQGRWAMRLSRILDAGAPTAAVLPGRYHAMQGEVQGSSPVGAAYRELTYGAL